LEDAYYFGAHHVRVAMCISCLNREWQLRLTLPQNLALSWGFLQVKWVVVIFDTAPEGGASPSARFTRWATEYLTASLASRQLVIYRAHQAHWHASICKNTAHMAARQAWGTDDFLAVNMDADNVVTHECVVHTVSRANIMDVGGPAHLVPRAMVANSSSSSRPQEVHPLPAGQARRLPGQCLVRYYQDKVNSTAGRIAAHFALFRELGGTTRTCWGPAFRT